MSDTDSGVVLLVEDNPERATTYGRWLSDYEVRRAESTAGALDALDSTVDVVVIERELPDGSGDDLLAEIHEREEAYQLLLLAEDDPGFESIELGFDAYLSRPLERGDLLETVEQLFGRLDLGGEMREFYSLQARRGALEAAFSQAELDDSVAYRTLVDRIESHEQTVDDSLGDMDSDEAFVDAVQELEEEPDETTSSVEAMSDEDAPPVDAYTESESAEDAAEELLEE